MISLFTRYAPPAKVWHMALLFSSLIFMSSASAFNRIDAIQALQSVRSSWTDADVEVWINNFRGDPDPGVLVGDSVMFSVQSRLPGYFLLALIDTKGETTLITTESGGATSQLVFPKQGGQEILEQTAPVGEQTLFAFASDTAFSIAQLGMAASVATLAKDRLSLDNLAASLNQLADAGKLAVSARYTYFVDSPDNKISTRGIKRAIEKQMVEAGQPPKPKIIINEPDVVVVATAEASSPLSLDIKFQYNSAELEAQGVSQLDVLGSGLISLLEDDQLPRISLEGHTDNSGSDEYNLALSGKRARAAREYLLNAYGLPGNNIEALGMGEGSPMVDNNTAASRAKNRRVELRVLR